LCIFSRLAVKQLLFLLLLSKSAAAKTAWRHHEQHKHFKDDQQAGGDLASLDRVDGSSQTKSGPFENSVATTNNPPRSGGLRKAQKNSMRVLSVASSVCKSFAVHAGAAITFAASDKISGENVGVSPGASITGACDLADVALLANAADSVRFAASMCDDWVAAMEIQEDAMAIQSCAQRTSFRFLATRGPLWPKTLRHLTLMHHARTSCAQRRRRPRSDD
jgi:hypothetical protein